MTFACISNFEPCSFETGPSLPGEVMAMSTGNLIFVVAPILCDPCEILMEHEVQRVIGNIGQAGIGFLIPPRETRIMKIVTRDMEHGSSCIL